MAPSASSHAGRTGPLSRFGDLLPLPISGEEWDAEGGRLGKTCRRRVQRRLTREHRVDSTLAALNELGGYRGISTWPRAPLNQAQVEAVGRIRRLHASGPIAKTSEEVSLREMLRTCGGYSASAGELASYRSGSVSWPDEAAANGYGLAR